MAGSKREQDLGELRVEDPLARRAQNSEKVCSLPSSFQYSSSRIAASRWPRCHSTSTISP
jgi:hypothetical protein